MNTKNNARAKTSINSLKKTLLQLLKEEEFQSISVLKLCTLAKVNRTTFYSHFDNINDIIMLISQDLIVTVVKMFNKKNSDIKKSIKEVLIYLHKNSEWIKPLIFNVDNVELKVFNTLKNTGLLKELGITEKNKELTLMYLISGFKGVMQKFLLEPYNYSLDDISNAIYNVLNWDIANLK